MKYLVTGGGGFIGSHIVDRLITDGSSVCVLDNFIAGKKENLRQHLNNERLKIYELSITEDLTAVFKDNKFDCVFHLAALPRVQFSIDYPIESHNVNIDGTLNLLQSCRNFGVNRFVFSSSSSIYGNQTKLPLVETMEPNVLVPYALQKLTGEYYCQIFYKLYGVETVILRYFSVYGPRQNPSGGYAQLIPKFIKLVSAGKQPLINGNGQHTRDFTFVSDVVEANVLAATTKNKKCFGEVFNIGAGQNLSINEVTNEIIKVCGKKIKPIYGPALMESKDTLANSSKAKEFFGWEPKTDFKKGLAMTYKFFADPEKITT